MDRKRLLSYASLIGGILVAAIGIMHTSASPMVYRNMAGLSATAAPRLTYFFAADGAYVIFCGWLMAYLARGLGRGHRIAWTVSLANALCNTMVGVGALTVGFRHAPAVAWFVINAALLALTMVARKSYPAAAQGLARA